VQKLTLRNGTFISLWLSCIIIPIFWLKSTNIGIPNCQYVLLKSLHFTPGNKSGQKPALKGTTTAATTTTTTTKTDPSTGHVFPVTGHVLLPAVHVVFPSYNHVFPVTGQAFPFTYEDLAAAEPLGAFRDRNFRRKICRKICRVFDSKYCCGILH
jgi:hypothetical protein